MSSVDPENGDPLENAEDPENGDLSENPQPEDDFQAEGTTNGDTIQVSSQPVSPESQESNPEPESEFGCHGNHEHEGSTEAPNSHIRDNNGDTSNSNARLDPNRNEIVGEVRSSCVSPVSVNEDTGMDYTNRIPEDDRNSNSEVEDNASDAEDGICVEEMCEVEREEGGITVEPCEADRVSSVETVSSSNEEAQLCSGCSGDDIKDAEEMSDCQSVKSYSVSPSCPEGAYKIENQSQEPYAVQNGANGLCMPEDDIDEVVSHDRNVEDDHELCEPECDQSSTDINTAVLNDKVELSGVCESHRSLNGCISVNSCSMGESDTPSYLQASESVGIESDHSSGEASCSAQSDRLVLSHGSLLHAEMNGQERNNDRKPNGHEYNSSAFHTKDIQDSASSKQKAANVDASNVHHSGSDLVASDKESHTGNDCATLTCQNLIQNVSIDLNSDASVSPKHSVTQEIIDNSLLVAKNASVEKLTSAKSMHLAQDSKGPNILLKVSDLSCSIDVSQDSEEELLSELDATLQCSPQTSAHCDINGDVMDKNCDNITEEEIPSQKDITELRDLKRQLRQAKQLLFQRECEISRLREENVEQSQRLDTAIREQDGYLREINNLRKKNSDDLYIPQIKELEYTIAQQQTEIRGMKEKLASHDASAKRAIVTLQNEVRLRVDQVTKTCEEAVKEKDAMVVRYAQAEHKNLEYQKLVERLEVKVKEAEREKETFLGKIKDLKEQKHKVTCDLEAKNSELGNTIRELEKHREMVSSSENRVKWAQNKLRAELEAHKETKVTLEKTIAKLNQAKEETEQIRKDCQAMIKTYQESEEIKSNSLDKELRQKESELMLHLQQKSSQQEQYSHMVKDMESLKEKQKETMAIMLALQDKVKHLEAEKQKYADTMHKYEEIIQRQKKDMKDLQDRIEKLVHAKEEFNRAQEVIKSLDGEMADLKMSNKDLMNDIEAYKRREADKLELTEKLSHKNAELQSENTNLSNKVLALTSEIQTITMEHQDQESKLKELVDRLAQVQKERQEEVTSLKDQLSEKNNTVNELSRKVEDGRDEIRTLKRKHTNNVKDLTRQLQQVRRKLDSYEVSTNGERDTTSLGSRTSSNGSLNTVGTSIEHNSSNAVVSYQSGHHLQQQTSEEHEYPVITEQVQVDKQIIIERIVKLQRALARKNEKIEFMDDHINHLVDELQKKNKIIQHYALREESGTMTADFMDRNKLSDVRKQVQVELSKKHSIMGSLYSSHSMDGTMTIDLSLEINRKLQAVLEDTLLKNITLKESLDTLGQEIARLSQENRSLQLKLQEKTKD
ncbi:hypothetical protein CHS0354_016605 [Potamilus streckersoni]|uniref:Coiled-coil domain-containing protein 186 n=1 Tax=Potamilus streckersoni TaxID=2493646 RepID=A0AAE0TI55_9BIVA|nr:hypothetical protein CHS0354_016605 [Potamilus streckersoni]